MTILVTGGAGFLGAWVTRALLDRGHAVRIFDLADDRRLSRAIIGAAADGLDWRIGDLRDGICLDEAARGCDLTIHLAGLMTADCQADPSFGAGVNVVGSLNVFTAAARNRHRAVLYASTIGVFGPEEIRFPQPTTFYGVFKLAVEGCARVAWANDRLPTLGVRSSIVYGPGRSVGLSAAPTLACRAAARSEPYTIPFTGRTDLIFVDDVVDTFVRAVERPPGAAVLADSRGGNVDIADVASEICRLVPGARIDASGEPLSFTSHGRPVAAERNASARTSLTEGLRRTIEWHRPHDAP